MFEAGVVVVVNPGSGQLLRAVLADNARAVAVCGTPGHRVWVQGLLQDYVKVARLCTLAGSPPKPEVLLAFEKAGKPAGGALPAATPPSKGGAGSGSGQSPSVILATGTPPQAAPRAPPPALAAFGSAIL